MKDEVIKELYKNHKPTEAEQRIYYDTADFVYAGFHAGCRITEPLAKIEVLELARKIFEDLDSMNPADYSDSFDVIDTLLAELKEAMK